MITISLITLAIIAVVNLYDHGWQFLYNYAYHDTIYKIHLSKARAARYNLECTVDEDGRSMP